jgi:hypothetical protein
MFTQSHALYIGLAMLAGLKILTLSCTWGLMMNFGTVSAPIMDQKNDLLSYSLL